ncbi:MAG: MotA/TolQ/ExbB proton channel family protein [Myxococcaceae bacterium]|nr:MotA/TolQ/ExbB proton channel family protein [Myxococcaceae bacterium]
MNVGDLIHYLKLGGFTMAIIVACSVVALGVAIERLIALWGVSDQARMLGEAVGKNLLRGDVAAARTAAERSDALAADIFIAGFERFERNRGGDGVEAAVERERTQVALKLRRNLWILGTIGATAPFVGLFGTVAGIMRSFRDLGLDVGAGGTGGTAAVMTGISEALITTAAGILVAVEAVVLYNYFQSRLARVAVELKLLAEEFVELLRERPAAPATTNEGSASAPTPLAATTSGAS